MIEVKEVGCLNRDSIPLKNETFETDFDIEKFKPWVHKIKELTIYRRNKEDCPFSRGNWMIDVEFEGNQNFAIKLPLEMEKEQVLEYAKPLMEILEKFKKDKMN